VPKFSIAYILPYRVDSKAMLYASLSGKSKKKSGTSSGSMSNVAMSIRKVINRVALAGKRVLNSGKWTAS